MTTQAASLKLLALAALAGVAACGSDLGECDAAALGGSNMPGIQALHIGQTIVGSSCAGGRCHSADAKGDARVGAPGDLDFDVVPAATTPEELAKIERGGTNVTDWAEEMWAQIEEGEMPPPSPAGPGELSRADKEAVRNWLACGAEVVPVVPAANPNDWASIWTVLAPSCTSCHATASVAGGNFVLGGAMNACESYFHVVNATAITTACAGMTVVAPANPAGSLLLQKLRGTQTCGSHMPLTSTVPLAAINPALVDTIEQWIAIGAPAPVGCTL